jgi:uncharacterized RDD family membrane protein YckC
MSDEGPSPLPREARPHQGRPAGLVTRTAAAVVDAVVVALLLLVTYAGWAALVFLVNPRGFSFPSPRPLLSLGAALGLLVVYLALSWWLGGRTYGALLMGLRVVRRDGGRVPAAIALGRALVCVLAPWGLFWVAVSRDRRSLHDLALGSRVVYDWQPTPRAAGTERRGPGGGSAKTPR